MARLTVTTMGWLAGVVACVMGCTQPEKLSVVYDERFGEQTGMDIFLPDDGGSARPAMMFIHGGGLTIGDRGHFELHAKRLARAGYVAATIDYRLLPEGTFPAPIQDCGCALSYLRSHADELGLDPDRIAIMGYSAGGYLSSILAFAAEVPELQPDCAEGGSGPPNAVVVGAGRSDLRFNPTDNLVEFLGGEPAEVPALWALASPLEHVDSVEPPALFVHGTTDRFVDAEEARRMHSALLDAGNESHLLELAGGGHILNPGVDLGEVDASALVDEPEVWIALVDFLASTVGKP